MFKTFAQQALELERGKVIGEIVVDTLEFHRGQPNIVTRVAAALGTSEPTIRAWCRDLGINIDDYRRAAPKVAP